MEHLAGYSNFLTPRVLCVAIAASSATAGQLGRGALPRLHELVANPDNAPQYADLLHALSDLPLFPVNTYGLDSDEYLSDEDTVHESVADYLDSVVREVRSVDELYSVAESILADSDSDVGSLIHGIYDRDGPIGCLLRKVVVVCSVLSFEVAVGVVDSLRGYVEGPVPDEDFTTRGSPSMEPISNDPNFSLEKVDAGVAAYALSSGMPVASDAAFRTLNGAPPTFASHLEALRRRNYAESVDALHRHYDLSLASIARSSNAASDAADARGHQYAALSLAALHYHLGHPRMAVAALDDAVRSSQQCADDSCQARALAWIARTSSSPEQRHQLLCHTRDSLALAREELQTIVTPPARAENTSVPMIRGETIWQRESRQQAAVARARLQRIHKHVGCKAGDVSVGALLVSAAAWESHASLSTALTVARMALRAARRQQRPRRRQKIEASGTSSLLTSQEATAMAAVALLEAKSGRAQQSVQHILDTINSSDSARIKPDFAVDMSSSRPEREVLLRCVTWMQFERALRRGESNIAGRLAQSMETFAAPNQDDEDLIGGADAELDRIEARCRWLLASRDYEGAMKEADLLARHAAKLTRPVRVVDGLRLTAQAHIQAGSANTALSPALSAVSLSRGLGIEAAHVRSMLTLTEAMLRIDGSGPVETGAAATRALATVLPLALDGLGVWERGVTRRLQAECALAMGAGGDELSVEATQSRGNSVVRYLLDAVAAFEAAEDIVGLRDCSYLLARVHHELGNIDERGKAARQYRMHVKQLADAQQLTLY